MTNTIECYYTTWLSRWPITLVKWFFKEVRLHQTTRFQTCNVWTSTLQTARCGRVRRFSAVFDFLTWPGVNSLSQIFCVKKFFASPFKTVMDTRQIRTAALSTRNNTIQKVFFNIKNRHSFVLRHGSYFQSMLQEWNLLNTKFFTYFRSLQLDFVSLPCGYVISILFFTTLYILLWMS